MKEFDRRKKKNIDKTNNNTTINNKQQQRTVKVLVSFLYYDHDHLFQNYISYYLYYYHGIEIDYHPFDHEQI